MIPSKGMGLPSVWAIIIAFVFFVIAFLICETAAFRVPTSLSISTAVHLFCKIGLTVVGNDAANVITSSPSIIARFPNTREVRAESANRFALEPELTRLT